MRLHLIEHDPEDFSRTNITRWAARKGYRIATSNLSLNDPLPGLGDFDWLMVMGGSEHAWELDRYPWLEPEKRFIGQVLETDKIVLGVCFGAQLLAEALGGDVFTADLPEIGWYEVTQTPEGRDSFLFENVPDSFTTFHWHSDHFRLPPGSVRLAQSPPTANQAFVLDGRPVTGVQFHPEYTREMVMDYARLFGREWKPGRYVAGPEAVIDRTETIPDTGWLMEAILDNMDRRFART